MISDRPYRKGLPIEVAIEEIKKYSGTQFHPDLANVFIEILEKEKLEMDTQLMEDMIIPDEKIFFAVPQQDPSTK